MQAYSQAPLTKRQRNELLRQQLEFERASFIAHWRDLGEYILPRRTRFFVGDANRGDRRNQKIINSSATLASRTLSAGMMSGLTSPARPWFRLSTSDPSMSEIGAVKDWLYEVTNIISNTFLKSNLYNTLPIVYRDLGVFGTAAYMIEEDFENVMRTQSFPVGSYSIAKDNSGRVNVFFREFRMTVRQIIDEFGKAGPSGQPDWSNFSIQIKNLYDQGSMEEWIDICHVIKPNDEFDSRQIHSKYKKFASCYYEKGTTANGKAYIIKGKDDDIYLRESGYDYFPVLCPRWDVTAEDVYATDCPGMTALGDIKQLQLGEKRIAQALELLVKPPMKGPSSLRTTKATILPGDITYDDSRDGKGFTPTFQIDPRIQEMEGKQRQLEMRISRCFFEDMFVGIINDTRSGTTAREIDERHEEKLLALGPVLERLNQDSNDPLIDIAFDLHLRQGLLPEAPPELQGMPLKVEYVSIMANAQKSIGIASTERFMATVANIVASYPPAADKIDADQLIDVYADQLSVAPGIVRSDEAVAQIRDAQAQQQAAAQEAAMVQQGAAAAKDLSQANMEGDNALTRLVDQSKAGQIVDQY